MDDKKKEDEQNMDSDKNRAIIKTRDMPNPNFTVKVPQQKEFTCSHNYEDGNLKTSYLHNQAKIRKKNNDRVFIRSLRMKDQAVIQAQNMEYSEEFQPPSKKLVINIKQIKEFQDQKEKEKNDENGDIFKQFSKFLSKIKLKTNRKNKRKKGNNSQETIQTQNSQNNINTQGKENDLKNNVYDKINFSIQQKLSQLTQQQQQKFSSFGSLSQNTPVIKPKHQYFVRNDDFQENNYQLNQMQKENTNLEQKNYSKMEGEEIFEENDNSTFNNSPKKNVGFEIQQKNNFLDQQKQIEKEIQQLRDQQEQEKRIQIAVQKKLEIHFKIQQILKSEIVRLYGSEQQDRQTIKQLQDQALNPLKKKDQDKKENKQQKVLNSNILEKEENSSQIMSNLELLKIHFNKDSIKNMGNQQINLLSEQVESQKQVSEGLVQQYLSMVQSMLNKKEIKSQFPCLEIEFENSKLYSEEFYKYIDLYQEKQEKVDEEQLILNVVKIIEDCRQKNLQNNDYIRYVNQNLINRKSSNLNTQRKSAVEIVQESNSAQQQLDDNNIIRTLIKQKKHKMKLPSINYSQSVKNFIKDSTKNAFNMIQTAKGNEFLPQLQDLSKKCKQYDRLSKRVDRMLKVSSIDKNKQFRGIDKNLRQII